GADPSLMRGVFRPRQDKRRRRIELVESERIDLGVLLMLAEQFLGGFDVFGARTAQAAGDFATAHAQGRRRKVLSLLERFQGRERQAFANAPGFLRAAA